MSIVSKAEFARMIGRDRSAVAHWKTSGKLTREPGGGLVDHNDKEQIDVAAACARLNIALDVGQSFGNGADTFQRAAEIARGAAPAPGQQADSTPDDTDPALKDTDTARLRAARAEREEQQVTLGRRKLAEEMGRWVDRTAAEAEFAREMTKVMSELRLIVEGALPDIVADRLGLDPHETRIAIRAAFREETAAIADRLKLTAAQIEEEPADAA